MVSSAAFILLGCRAERERGVQVWRTPIPLPKLVVRPTQEFELLHEVKIFVSGAISQNPFLFQQQQEKI